MSGGGYIGEGATKKYHEVDADEEDDVYIDDGLVEEKKEKTLKKMLDKMLDLFSKVHTSYYRCPLCPGRRCDRWTISVLCDYARALGVPGNYTYKVAGKHQALEEYIRMTWM
ncbi:unnamed protein product [Urochloa decumbens]|uniref:Uncharacterized protein n=1 Tax=Urochloa decumbens TaxID=240449 RepID=A0ABC8W171_9POAL